MENTRTITIGAQEVQNGKQKFVACHSNINKKWYKIKFTKDVKDAPTEKGIYELTIDFDDCSIERGKKYNNGEGKKVVGNDTIWVRHIVGLRKFTEEEMKLANRQAMSEIFGGK